MSFGPLEISPEQEFGARFLSTRTVALLGDGPGYGKSAQFVRAADYVGARKITILCPPGIPPGELAEYEKWSLVGWPVTILKTAKCPVPEIGVVICNYVLAGYADVAKRLRKRGCDVLILDEGHHVKNPTGARTKAIFLKHGIASTAARIWFVTANLVQNDASEYFVFAKVCGAWKGTRREFVERYCVLAEGTFGEKIIGSRDDTRAELLAMLAPFVLARFAIEDGRSALQDDWTPVDGAPPDYSGVDPVALEEIRLAIEAGNWKALDGPAVATVRRITGTAKIQGALSLAVAALEGGHRQLLIFADHRDVIDSLADGLKKFSVGVIDGRTTEALKERIIQDFAPGENKPPPAFRVAICQRQALKEGRELKAATRVLLVEPFWNEEDNKQMIARAWRRGQTKPVHASRLYLPGSIDDAVIKTTRRKSADLAKLKIGPNIDF